jgi:ribonuclease-3
MNNSEFQQIIGYMFNDPKLLDVALTHSSYCRENGTMSKENNERLEFLGDAFFDAIISVELYRKLKHENEGKLTKTRALIVCEKSLANMGMKLNIGQYLNMGKGEVHSGGRYRESIIADAMEAVIGAIFMDGGYETARKFVVDTFTETIDNAISGKLFTDYKTQVQEALQLKGQKTVITYNLDREEGPDHDKTFYVHLICNGKRMGSGSGKSKKEAEQNAAKATLMEGIK